jgi:molybdopterin-containing oxidoreductase family iron-sulfur binding subunit
MSQNKYWQSLEQLQDTAEYKEKAGKEFQEELPVFDYVDDTTKVESTGRRDFLKMLGFSVSAAAIASSCKIPVKKAIPYVFDMDASSRMPEVLPGIADYFASTYYDGADYQNILVKTRENRPIKIEGNTAAPFTEGATSMRSQASVLSLYDTMRIREPQKAGNPITWEQADQEISAKLAEIAAQGGKIAVITNSSASLLTKKALEQFKSKYPTTTVVTYDGISLSAMRKANAVTLGSAVIPSYLFDKAMVIVGFNCDFLGTWITPSENAKRYSKNRVPSKDNPVMSRHYQFQSNVTITGSAADYKYPIKPSEEKAVLMALYNKVATASGNTTLPAAKINSTLQAAVDKVAAELLANKGASLVVSGTNDVDIQLLTNAINAVLGNYGSTIDTNTTVNVKQGNDEALKLLADANDVKAVILLGANPVYDTPFSAAFQKLIQGATLSVSTADRVDESAQFAQYVTPDNHYLESWDVLEPKSGFFSFVQPTINQLFDTRQSAVSLMKWSGVDTSAYDMAVSVGGPITSGITALLGNTSWETALQQGFVNNTGSLGGNANISATLSAINPSLPQSKGLELVLFESIALGDGKAANNAFLQEMPDPVTRVAWDNYIAVPYSFAIANGMKAMDSAKEVPIAKVTIGDVSISLPVVISYGQAQDTLAIALGYGRTHAGPAAEGSGKNAYPFLKYLNGTVSYNLSGATFEWDKGLHILGIIQTYHTLQEDVNLPGRPRRYRDHIVKETNLAAYKENELAGNEDRDFKVKHLTTLYKPFDKPGHHWSMAVDLNSCIGCGACVMACNVENNIPVVGRKEIYKTRSMHWIRIDRYYSGDPDNPDVAFQPLMCQHCDNAPCENVCPVNATNHSSEGLNQMAYNRCIGTKYCANNCPFKVRKFNWYDYQGNDSFGSWTNHKAAPYMFDDLTRMILNPDVTVRSKGVIEKCSFCVQRIQAGKLAAKSEGRPLKDGDIKTACQTACPTNAIVFGDRNDENSEIHKIFFTNKRNYHLYEEQHFLPNVGYLVKIRNKEEAPSKEFIGKIEKA